VDADPDTLATALYVTTDELLQRAPQLAPWRPAVGIAPKLTDAELVTLAVLQALLGFCSEARWLRYAHAHLGCLFPSLPKQPGYNKCLRAAAGRIQHVIRMLASDTTWWTDDVWVADSTPVECGRSRETTKRSELAGWGPVRRLRQPLALFLGAAAAPGLHPAGPAGRLRAGRRQSRRAPGAAGHPCRRPDPAGHPGWPDLIADKHDYGAGFEAELAAQGVRLLRPARKGEPDRAGAHLFRPLRQLIESVNDTFKGQLDLERHGGRTPGGVTVRVLQRVLALTTAIWHNHHTGQPTLRSLVAYDH
jgi:hypothetical protein